MEDEDLNLNAILERVWFGNLIGPYLSFADLRHLGLSNKSTLSSVQELVQTWPDEIRELLRVWCGGSRSLLTFGFYGCWNESANIIRFNIYNLSYNDCNKLSGQP